MGLVATTKIDTTLKAAPKPARPETAFITCPDCKGRGAILLLVSTVPCTLCGGRGRVPAPNPYHAKPVADLELSPRSHSLLRRLRVVTVGQLIDLTEENLLAHANGSGPQLVDEIKKVLRGMGLKLREKARA